MAIYRVKESFACPGKDGYTHLIQADTLVDSADRVKGLEHLYEPVEVAAARQTGVEEATAEPGALRSVSTGAHTRGPGRPRKSEETSTEPPSKKD